MTKWEKFKISILEEAFDILEDKKYECSYCEKPCKCLDEEFDKLKQSILQDNEENKTFKEKKDEMLGSILYPYFKKDDIEQTTVNGKFQQLFNTKESLSKLILHMGDVHVHHRFNLTQVCIIKIDDEATLCDISRLWYDCRQILDDEIVDKIESMEEFPIEALEEFPSEEGQFSDPKKFHDIIVPLRKELKELRDEMCCDKLSLCGRKMFLEDKKNKEKKTKIHKNSYKKETTIRLLRQNL